MHPRSSPVTTSPFAAACANSGGKVLSRQPIEHGSARPTIHGEPEAQGIQNGRQPNGHVLMKKTGQSLDALTSILAVELPGIEPAPKMVVTCGNAEFDYPKVRETTRKYLRIRRRC
jgi:hypothetical protein